MIKLYSYFRSSSSYRVRLALELKSLNYEIIPVHLIREGGEQHLAGFKKINAASKIPVLVHNQQTIAQSIAIIEYLEQVFPQNPLLPLNPFQQAICRQMCEIINSDIQPLQNLGVLQKLTQQFNMNEEQKLLWIQHWIRLGFASYEALVEKHGGAFSLGDTPTMADCFLIPQIYNAHRFSINMNDYPRLKNIEEIMMKQEAYKKAHPDNQPDTPQDIK